MRFAGIVGGRGYGKPVTDQTVLTVPDVRVVRDELQRLVLVDLLGPLGGEREEFGREDPLDRVPAELGLRRVAPRWSRTRRMTWPTPTPQS